MRRWVGWAALLLTGCGSTADQPTTGVTPASLIGEDLPVTTCVLKPSPNVFRVVVDAAGIHLGGALVVSTTELDGHTMGLPELAAVIPKGCDQAVIAATAHSSWGAFGRAAMTLHSAGVDHVFVEASRTTAAGSEVGSFEEDVPHPGPDRMVSGIDMEAYVGPLGVRLHSDDLGNSATLTVQGVGAAAVRYKPRTGPGVATVMVNVAADVQAYISVERLGASSAFCVGSALGRSKVLEPRSAGPRRFVSFIGCRRCRLQCLPGDVGLHLEGRRRHGNRSRGQPIEGGLSSGR